MVVALVWFGWTLGTAPALPDHVAIHFGRGGWADGWALRAHYLYGTLAYGAALGLLFCLLPVVLPCIPTRWLSLPRAVLEAPIPPPQLHALIRAFLDRTAALLWSFLLLTQVLVVTAHRQRPPQLQERWLWIGLVLFLAGLGAALWGLWRQAHMLARQAEAFRHAPSYAP